jgi:hypothetical protein
MKDVSYTTLDGRSAQLNASSLDALAAGIRGGIVTPDAADYDAARKIWNGMVERRPAVIARCLNAQDVRTALGFAREHDMRLSLRGAGHHIAGNSVADGGLVIDQCARCAGRAARRFRPRGAGLRACHAARHQLDDRRRRPLSGRRLRLADAQARHDDR